MLKKAACALFALIFLSALAPFSEAQAASAPIIEADDEVYNEGDVTTLTWTGISGANAYDLFISKAPYGEKNLVVEDTVSECEYNVAGLSAGKYRANVRAVTENGTTGFSNVVYFTVRAATSGEVSADALDSADVSVTFLWPVKDDPEYTGSSYAVTAMDLYYDGGKHGTLQNALDINSDGMTTRYETREIVSTAAGTVIEVHKCGHTGISCPTRSCEGTYIKIQHELPDPETGVITTYISCYCHLDPLTVAVEEGEYVEQGQTIARMGSSGNSSGIHLHFAIRNADNKDLPTLEFFMNDFYMPLLRFKYFKQSSSGNFVTTNGKTSRYSDWITQYYVYSSSQGCWVYNKQ